MSEHQQCQQRSTGQEQQTQKQDSQPWMPTRLCGLSVTAADRAQPVAQQVHWHEFVSVSDSKLVSATAKFRQAAARAACVPWACLLIGLLIVGLLAAAQALLA
jgi:uncharacterized membrane protein